MKFRLIFASLAMSVALDAIRPEPSFAQEDRPALSNGFQYGMSPEEVTRAALLLQGVKSAKVRESKGQVSIDVSYTNTDLDRFGFKFLLGFTFLDRKLIWVDLIGHRGCAGQVSKDAIRLIERFTILYGEPDDGNVFHLRNVDVYVLAADHIPQEYRRDGQHSTGYLLEVYDMQRQCRDETWANVTVRYKGNPTPVLRPVSPSEMDAAQHAAKAQAAKDQSDAAALALPH